MAILKDCLITCCGTPPAMAAAEGRWEETNDRKHKRRVTWERVGALMVWLRSKRVVGRLCSKYVVYIIYVWNCEIKLKKCGWNSVQERSLVSVKFYSNYFYMIFKSPQKCLVSVLSFPLSDFSSFASWGCLLRTLLSFQGTKDFQVTTSCRTLRWQLPSLSRWIQDLRRCRKGTVVVRVAWEEAWSPLCQQPCTVSQRCCWRRLN